MLNSPPERDWKYFRSVRDELLAALCGRINKESAAILSNPACSEHEKYIALWRHINDADEVIGECFNDPRRSNLLMKLFAMQRHGLLRPEHVENFSPETRDRLQAFKQLSGD